MSKICKFNDHIMMIADYKDPEPHKHLASHIIISLEGSMECQIEDKCVKCSGICIGPDITHTAKTFNSGTLILFFTQISSYSKSINDLLNGQPYAVLPDEIVERILEEYDHIPYDTDSIDASILSICGIYSFKKTCYDMRIAEALNYIDTLDTINPSIVDDISRLVFLSKSRFSHLFKKETGMTLHSYLAFEKLHKACEYISYGMNVTDGCMLAGFNSSSHFSSTCKRIFGLSISDVYKTIASK